FGSSVVGQRADVVTSRFGRVLLIQSRTRLRTIIATQHFPRPRSVDRSNDGLRVSRCYRPRKPRVIQVGPPSQRIYKLCRVFWLPVWAQNILEGGNSQRGVNLKQSRH